MTGNCGLSAVGFEPDTPHQDKMGGGLFSFRDVTGVYPTVREFFDAVDRNMPCNIAVLMGHCAARSSVAGYENRLLTEEENRRLLAILEQGLKEGACGTSLGLMYEPDVYAATEEFIGTARLSEKYDRPMTIHPRANSAVSMAYPQLLGMPHLLRAMDELVDISRGNHMKLQYSHAIFVGRKSFKCREELVSLIHQMREAGVDARFDIYNELMSVSVITVVMPAWYQALSLAEKRKPLNKLKFSVLAAATIVLLGFGWDDIQIAYLGPGHEQYEGKTVAQFAKEMGRSNIDAYLGLCEMSDNKGRVNMGTYSTPEIVSQLAKDNYCLYMTDAWVEEQGVQNPAIYDCFPTFLRDAPLGAGTVRKMTGAVADRFSIPNRGYLKPGYYADVTVFNEEALKSGLPDQGKAFGIEKVFINGRLVLDGERLNGEVLRSSGRAMRAE